MVDVQVVFQGGGARVAALLAAADALRQAERCRKIRVTRVAGTSAGAIVAALFANRDIDLNNQVRHDILIRGQAYLDKLFPKLDLYKMLLCLWRGKPFYE